MLIPNMTNLISQNAKLTELALLFNEKLLNFFGFLEINQTR